MFFIAKKEKEKSEELAVQIETLKKFCYRKYQEMFLVHPLEARAFTDMKINEWIAKGQIEKRLKQMWQEREF